MEEEKPKAAPFICVKCDTEHLLATPKCTLCNRKTIVTMEQYLDFRRARNKDEVVQRLIQHSFQRQNATGLIIVELSGAVQNMEEFVSFRDNGELYYYEDGVFIPNGDAIVDEQCTRLMHEAHLERLLNAHVLREVKNKIIIDSYRDREEFDANPEFVCLNNGVFNIETKDFLPHSPDFRMLVKLPVTYVPDAFPVKFDAFLRQIVAEENIPLMYEIIGYCLYRNYSHHKAFMFIGEGANGKSTFIDIVRRFLGDDNCVNIPLQELEESRFAKGNLYRKLANLSPDLSSRAMKTSGTFKMATGGDALTVDKKFKDMFTFTNYAKFIFSANRIPSSPDDSNAFFRRWVIVNFPNHFEGATADKLLKEKLSTCEELSGIFNASVCGLKHVLNNGGFTAEQTMEEAREIYTRLSDSVAAFVMDKVEPAGGDSQVAKKKMLETYNEYCRTMKYPAVSDVTFYKRMNTQIRFEESQRRLDGIPTRVWIGIKLKEPTSENTTKDEQLSLEA